MKMFTLFSVLFFVAMNSFAQAEDPAAAYTRTLNQRSAKIVAALGIADSTKFNKVQSLIVQQYRDINAAHEIADEQAKEQKLKQVHTTYLTNLSSELNAEQVDKVKDGMTYNVFHVTYTAYQDMIPKLTDNQKTKIYDWLKEAREQAMDQGSSDAKHKVFGKYKGRINNYLSAEGYDLKAEEKAWQERLRKKREQKG